VIWLTLVLNWTVAAIKIFVGIISGSVTVLADGFHGLVDGANNILGILAMRIASRPPDEDHPYGHQKFENVAAMIIGGLVFLLGWEIVKEVFHNMRGAFAAGGETPLPGVRLEWYFVALVAGTLGTNIFVSTYEWREGVRLGSPFLKADAAHTRSDVMVTSMSLASLLVGSRLPWLDMVLSLAVVGFIFYAGWNILLDNLNVFTDRIRLAPEDVRRVVESVPGVQNTHAIRSHGSETDVHLDLHIVVSENLTAKQTAQVELGVQETLRGAFPNITFISIHHQTEPHDPNTPLWKD
jgi:cation diffusion facilitator family transporter